MRYPTMIGWLLLGILSAACGPSNQEQLEANRDLVRRLAATNDAEEWDVLDSIVAEDLHRHSRATTEFPEISSREEWKQYEKTIHTAFPDRKVTYEIMVAEGDMVAAYATFTGTNTGPLGELPATRRRVEVKFLAMFRIEEGKIVEIWAEFDNISRLVQLGLYLPEVDRVEAAK